MSKIKAFSARNRNKKKETTCVVPDTQPCSPVFDGKHWIYPKDSSDKTDTDKEIAVFLEGR